MASTLKNYKKSPTRADCYTHVNRSHMMFIFEVTIRKMSLLSKVGEVDHNQNKTINKNLDDNLLQQLVRSGE